MRTLVFGIAAAQHQAMPAQADVDVRVRAGERIVQPAPADDIARCDRVAVDLDRGDAIEREVRVGVRIVHTLVLLEIAGAEHAEQRDVQRGVRSKLLV